MKEAEARTSKGADFYALTNVRVSAFNRKNFCLYLRRQSL